MMTVYAQKWMLPARRLQMTLARVGQGMAGGKLADFLFDYVEKKTGVANGGAGDMLAAAGGVGVKRRKKKRG